VGIGCAAVEHEPGRAAVLLEAPGLGAIGEELAAETGERGGEADAAAAEIDDDPRSSAVDGEIEGVEVREGEAAGGEAPEGALGLGIIGHQGAVALPERGGEEAAEIDVGDEGGVGGVDGEGWMIEGRGRGGRGVVDLDRLGGLVAVAGDGREGEREGEREGVVGGPHAGSIALAMQGWWWVRGGRGRGP
jgi:hypothetical protein